MSDPDIVSVASEEIAGDLTQPDTVEEETTPGADGDQTNTDTQGDQTKPETKAETAGESEVIDGGLEVHANVPNYDGSAIIDYISEDNLPLLHAKFLKAPKARLTPEGFRNALDCVLGIVFTDYDFQSLFLKMQARRDGFISWDDVVSYLTLEYQERDVAAVQVNLDTPIDSPPRLVKSQHRHPITRLIFCPALGVDRKLKYKRGCYASVTHEGMINYWDLDMVYKRSVTSRSVFLKVCRTWVTDVIALPDFDILCTSSMERDLRFYDTTACLFELRVVVTSLASAVVAMHYAWSDVVGGDGHLVTGDTAGTLRVYTLCGKMKGPFLHVPGVDTRVLLSEQVLRGELPGMRVKEYRGVHNDWVRQVYFSKTLSSLLSCALSTENAVVLRDAQGDVHTFHVAQGVKCFAVQENAHLLATGGPDCLVRLWNIFVAHKAVCVFRGHHACIFAVVIQADTQRVISISKDRCVKVWDITFQNCIQTYTQLPATLGDQDTLTALYNPLSHAVIVTGMHFAIISCGVLMPEQLTDGFTHAAEVTVIVYNPLFQVLISVGCRSMIMVWNPWKNQRKMVIKLAHTKLSFGMPEGVEITSATFDPSYHLLLTGARDGTVKMWDFNTGSCIRNLSIEPDREVCSLIWLKGRILATGWNRHVEEWADGSRLSPAKCWEQRHVNDIMTAAAHAPQCLATGSYSGELIFWRMETGQPFRRHAVGNPTVQSKLDYLPKPGNLAPTGGNLSAPSVTSQLTTKSEPNDLSRSSRSMTVQLTSTRSVTPRSRLHRVSETSQAATMRYMAVHCLHFLRTRPAHPSVGSLLVALENGHVQVWSHHSAGGFLAAFQSVHTTGDYVISMATDPQDNYLFIGTTSGYLKVWLMANFYSDEQWHVCMPLLRLQFPFMWGDRINGRAKRRNRGQPFPILLSSHRAHLRAINSLIFVTPAQVLMSCSNDMTVRIWTLGGRYLGTLGPPRYWVPISPETGPGEDYPYRVPPDIKRVGSYTTIRVLSGGLKWWESPRRAQQLALEKTRRQFPEDLLMKCIHGQPLRSPRLGHFFQLPSRSEPPDTRPRIEIAGSRIPVFCHLALVPEAPVTRPKTPTNVRDRRNRARKELNKTPSASFVAPF